MLALFTVVALALSTGGLHGRVVIDPARPVCMAGQSCSAPDRHDLLVFWRTGRRVAETTTDANGNYRVSLAAGRYTVTTPRRRGIGRGLEPKSVVVPRRGYVRVDFTLDIGIR